MLHAWSALQGGLPDELMSWASLLHFVEEPADASTFFALFDPDDLFQGNHHIPPADAALARVAAG